MLRKIKHALVTYVVTKEVGGKTVKSYETAFRNQVVDIPDDQVKRLDDLGATVAPKTSLERPGTMMVLTDTATDEEIVSWVTGATEAETEALIADRPVMADRIRAAAATVAERFAEQNRHLGGVDGTPATVDAAGGGSEADTPEAEAEGDDDEDLIGDPPTSVDPADVVKGTAREVAEYIANNPDQANAILVAEEARAVASKEDVRVTIVRAAEAAAGFTSS